MTCGNGRAERITMRIGIATHFVRSCSSINVDDEIYDCLLSLYIKCAAYTSPFNLLLSLFFEREKAEARPF